MENKKSIYNIKCDWSMGENYDAAEHNNSSWSGKMLVRERDGSIKGYVCDEEKKELGMTHAIIVTFAPGAGISVLKLALRGDCDPIAFTGLLKKDIGVYRGHFEATTYFGSRRLGVCDITAESEQVEENEFKALNDKINGAFVFENEFNSLLVESNGEEIDHTEVRDSLKDAFEKGLEA